MWKRIRELTSAGWGKLTGPPKNCGDDQFDSLLARMQTPIALAGMKDAFNATPRELGQAALAGTRKRTRST